MNQFSEKLKFNPHQVSFQYLSTKSVVQITGTYNGSSRLVHHILLTFSAIQTVVGRRKICLARSTSHLTLAHHQTITAHSGNIQFFQIFFNSILT